VVIDLDGTRQAARQRARPQTEDLPAPQRRLNKVCAAFLHGAQARGDRPHTHRGLSLAHSCQWLGSFGNRGNGRYREELRQGLSAIGSYLQAYQLAPTAALLRLDGQHGTGAVMADLADFPFVMRGKDDSVLDRPEGKPPSALACRSAVQPSGKRSGAPALRLSRCRGGAGGRPLPRRGDQPPSVREKEPDRSHSQGGGLRTLFHQPATRGVHRSRCGGAFLASGCECPSTLR
jgi:hypothetical protein